MKKKINLNNDTIDNNDLNIYENCYIFNRFVTVLEFEIDIQMS